MAYTLSANAYTNEGADGRLAANAASGSAATHSAEPARNARRSSTGYTLHPHETPSCRRRADLRDAAHDRARADAHFLGRHVLPLCVSCDLDRALRLERQRRLPLHGPA